MLKVFHLRPPNFKIVPGPMVLCVAARDGSARRTDAWDVHVRLRVLLPALAAADGRVGDRLARGSEAVAGYRLVLFVMWCNWLTGVARTLSFGTVILVSIQQKQHLEHERWGDLVRQLLAMHASKKGSSLFSTSPTMMWSFIANCSLVTLPEMKWSMHTAQWVTQ